MPTANPPSPAAATAASPGNALAGIVASIAATAGPGSAPATVPPVREELRLLAASNNSDGSPAWMIQDPVTNKFYRIGWLDFEILSRWSQGSVSAIVDSVNNDTTLQIDQNDVKALAGFLQQHDLLRASSAAAVQQLLVKSDAGRLGWIKWLIHHYLFIRLPLVRPQALLAQLLPYLRWIFSVPTALVVVFLTATGVFLVARQWDTFLGTLVDQLSYTGAISFSAALVFSKCLHEVGHALTATRYGVRVAHMGIALLVMFPMPYTDTSESWKLSRPRQRLAIASAGIVAELALAGLATLAWSLAPDGPLRNGLFFLATTSWVLTLAVNISPFMRFDGYFILSDLIDFPNLHERSGAMARTWMRRNLLGLNEPWPEEFPRKTAIALVVFALGTWIYRLILFIGIAWLVYYFFFKVLGIILFIVEIWWFVVQPIWRELWVWYQRRTEIRANRLGFAAVLLLGLLLLGFVPWQTSVRGTAWVHAARQTVIFTPLPGTLLATSQEGLVAQGARLFQLSSPDITLDTQRIQAQIDGREAELRSLTGQEDGESQRGELQAQREKFSAELKGQKDELKRLAITAPFAGRLQDLDDGLTVGSWVHPKQALAVLIDPQSWVVDVLVEESDIGRVRVGDAVELLLQRTHLEKLPGRVEAVDTGKLSTLPHPLLDAQHGGPIATLQGSKQSPVQALYRVRVRLQTQPDLRQMAMGTASIQTEAKAWLPSVLERVYAVVIRESGF